MIVGIDFNHTFSADPEAFSNFIKELQSHGHTVVMITSRSEWTPQGTEVKEAVGNLLPIVFAGEVWKKEAAEAKGYKVDIWIDDKPGGIEHHRSHHKHHETSAEEVTSVSSASDHNWIQKGDGAWVLSDN